MRPIENLAGRKFGRWTVLRLSEQSIPGDARWVCRCSCAKGAIKHVLHRSLKHEHSKSCGCLGRERLTKHGMWRSYTYASWQAMIDRCEREGHQAYSNYGGRGVKICSGLRKTFKGFLSVVGERPRGLTLDRKNNNLNYSCGACSHCRKNGWTMNVRWATAKMQRNNARNSVLVTIGGETKNLFDWCSVYKVPHSTIRLWIKKGVAPKDALEARSRGERFSASSNALGSPQL